MKKIKDLFTETLNWIPIIDNERDFYCLEYPMENTYLRMNNFPVEPMWTLFFNEEQFDFDDNPKIWTINYRTLGVKPN